MVHRANILKQTVASAALAMTLLAMATPAFAQSNTNQSNGGFGFLQGLISYIEQKFGLDHNQVQSAVQQYQSQRNATITPRPTLTQQQMSDREKTRLDKLVSSGKITSDQETAILNELSSEQSKYMSQLQEETPQQRRTTMQSIQSDLKTWAQTNNINPMYVMSFGAGMKGGRGMMRGGHGKWGNSWNSPTPTPGS